MTQKNRFTRFGRLVVLLVLVVTAGEARAQSDVGALFEEIRQLTEQALEASRAAEGAQTVADVKRHADAVFAAVWGVPSGLVDETARGAVRVHGWKTRWQVDGSEFDSAFVARYGSAAPEVQDPRALGILGRALQARKQVAGLFFASPRVQLDSAVTERVVAPLNNVVGWMRIDDGVTKGERQPRVDLTYLWDAPIDFWNSTADTGWLYEVYSQAVNILKTDYDGDAETARRHAAGMRQLLEKVLQGVDANGNGVIEPVMMEGGLYTALEQARQAGLLRS